MGRRSINTTKSGKYMNPTDQARKEARKKELKKNKKQRQMVRAAVLKGKDPAQLIEEMEKIDEMEFNVLQPSPLNEKVLREKRKKLKETFDRVMRLYHNDDLELWNELRRKEHEYEKRRAKRVQYFESVRTAQTVSIEDIPLPDMTDKPMQSIQLPPNPFPSVPMPPDFQPQTLPPNLKVPMPTVQSKSIESNQTTESKRKDPPGCPAGLPPDLFKMPELDTDYESDDSEDSRKSPISKRRRYSSEHSSSHSDDQNSASDNESDVQKPTSVQQRFLAIAGQKIDDFMKDLENVHKKDRNNSPDDKTQEVNRNDSEDSDSRSGNEAQNNGDKKAVEPRKESEPIQKVFEPPPRPENPMGIPNISAVPMPPPIMKLPHGPPPPPMGMPPMFRHPPMRMHGQNPMGMRMPGPMMPRLRMPPGPPPGMPPRMMNMHRPPQQNMQNVMHPQQLPKDNKGMTTITAKPQIRNLSADVTRFVPTALRSKREEKKPKPKPFVSEYNRPQQKESVQPKGTTKDDAYMQFMREMQGLL